MKTMLFSIGFAAIVVNSSPAGPPISLLSGSAKDELGGDLRGLLLQNLPDAALRKRS